MVNSSCVDIHNSSPISRASQKIVIVGMAYGSSGTRTLCNEGAKTVSKSGCDNSLQHQKSDNRFGSLTFSPPPTKKTIYYFDF